ncbi:MAG TPA: helix-turn-helix transcriptional regulator [Stellaceae bacterium]|nr:helix-turn-helix transcriptional regulator [Stellaceae bacterium]
MYCWLKPEISAKRSWVRPFFSLPGPSRSPVDAIHRVPWFNAHLPMRKRCAYRDGPDPIDRHVGRRLRARRILLGLSQTSLGKTVGLTFQQIQKYERGTNRVSASALFKLSHTLDVPVAFFFEEMPHEFVTEQPAPRARTTSQRAETVRAGRGRMTREMLELERAYLGIRDKRTRQQVFTFIKAFGQNTASSG